MKTCPLLRAFYQNASSFLWTTLFAIGGRDRRGVVNIASYAKANVSSIKSCAKVSGSTGALTNGQMGGTTVVKTEVNDGVPNGAVPTSRASDESVSGCSCTLASFFVLHCLKIIADYIRCNKKRVSHFSFFTKVPPPLFFFICGYFVPLQC